VGIVTDANHPEISCEHTPQHKLSDLQCSNEPQPKFKDGYFLTFLMCLPDAKPNLRGKVTVVQACLEAISMMRLNKSAQQNWLKKIT
jgi:hypothetical protein